MSARPNVLLLLSDEHSFRFMGHVSEEEGGEPAHTPNFDDLASNGTRFSAAYCQVAVCTPSRISMLTGLESRESGAWWNDSVLRPELPTLPAVLAKAGYETCLVGKMHLGGRNQFAGFHHRPYGDLTGETGHQWEPLDSRETGPYEMRVRTAGAGVSEIPESQMQEAIVVEEGLSFVREQAAEKPEQPWFLCLSFSRPHFPLTAPKRHFSRYWPEGATPPRVGPHGDAFDHPLSRGMREGFRVEEISEEESLRARAGYFACVTYLDEIAGDLLARLEREGHLENTVVIYTSDHGEMAGEHGVWWKQGWYEGCTRVPLLMSLPEQRSGEGKHGTIRTPVALTDLFPTICSLTGTDCPADIHGRDLSAAVRSGNEPEERPVVCDNLVPRWGEGTEFRMVRWGKYKYVRFRDAANLLFDLAEDPDEQRNLVDSDDPDVTDALERLEAFVRETMDFAAAEQERTERDGELAQQYRLEVEAPATGNLYLMPSGRLVNAEDVLYNQTVVLERPNEVLIGKPDDSSESEGRS
ncbi:MAG: sulfatase-like hydrolase/transferase [Trueperaceae bacterium]